MRVKLLIGLLLIVPWAMWHPSTAQASCEVHTAPLTYSNLTFLGVDLCDANGSKRVTGGGAATATATAAAPTYTEGLTTAPLSLDLTGALRVKEQGLRYGEDVTNNQLMTGPGVSKQTVIATAMLVAGDGAFKASQVGMGGTKTFSHTITGAAGISQRVKLYGSFNSTMTLTNSVELCDWTVTGTTEATGACPGVITANFPWISVVSSSSTGTPSGTLTMGFGN